jgi:uridine kinase
VHHRRTPATLSVCGRATDVIIVDGIFVLWSDEVRNLCDVTLFTAEDSDVCLARRLRRDILERGRTVESVLTQYLRFVRTGYINFVAPSMSTADFIIPRARENVTAIDMLARDIRQRIDGL